MSTQWGGRRLQAWSSRSPREKTPSPRHRAPTCPRAPICCHSHVAWFLMNVCFWVHTKQTSPPTPEKGNISCYISKQECHSHQWFWPSKYEFLSSKGTQEGEEFCYLTAIRLQPLPMVSPRDFRMWKQRRTMAPESWDAQERNDFSESRLLRLPIHRNALNSLTWDIWFSLTIIFWCSNYLPFVAQLLFNLAPPPNFLGAVISRALEMLSSGLGVLKIPTK